MSIQNIKGMPDILPSQSPLWQYVEQTLQQTLARFGYQQIRLPIVEYTDLFKRSIGEVTDIVEKEMYTFADRNDELLTLRPEGTAGCVRAVMQNGLIDNQAQQRLWYQGPMFRYEKPQKGRQRQFHQFGVETFGIATADIDAELIVLSHSILQAFGLDTAVTLQLNSIGSIQARGEYKKALLEYLSGFKDQLDDDSKRRLDSNPLRILDSKAPQTQAIIEGAPKLHDYLDEGSKEHFEQLCNLLDAAGISYEVNQQLVRGLDYYNKTVFEWVTTKLGAQGTVCAGGRYDGLVEQLGGKPTAAVGFAIGLERLCLLLEALALVPEHLNPLAVYFVVAGGADVQQKAMQLSQALRKQMPSVNILMHCGGGSFKSQMKKADKSGAQLALILGSNELEQQQVAVKFLRADQPQQMLAMATLADDVQQLLKNKEV